MLNPNPLSQLHPTTSSVRTPAADLWRGDRIQQNTGASLSVAEEPLNALFAVVTWHYELGLMTIPISQRGGGEAKQYLN